MAADHALNHASPAARARSSPWHILLAIFREIFDENAYARFLARTRQPDSRAAFIAFQDERATSQSERPRCC